MTAEKVDLGRRLFYDERLSGNQTFSCATCHQQPLAFTDGSPRAMGSTGAIHARSTMSLANVAYNASLGWADPSLTSLEVQMAVPMFNEHPIELGLKGRETEVVARFEPDAHRFRAAFPADPNPVTLPNIVKAIAAFERTMLSGDSPLDRYLYRDDKRAMPPAALRGMTLFFSDRLRCGECHASFNLSGPVFVESPVKQVAANIDALFHNTALYDVDGLGSYPARDRGLLEKTGKPSDMGRFRAPTLRNIAVTAPYMHDGSIPTLDAAVMHYAAGGKASPFRSSRIKGFEITSEEKADLLMFLESLTDTSFLTNPSLAMPEDMARQAKTSRRRLNEHGEAAVGRQ
jgi:cytochrome c peroxidase